MGMIATAFVEQDGPGWKVEIEEYYGTLYTYGPFRWNKATLVEAQDFTAMIAAKVNLALEH